VHPTTWSFSVRPIPVTLAVLLAHSAAGLAAQSSSSRPAIVVLNLRFDDEHANVRQPTDTAVVAAATSKLLATLAASERVRLVDSGTVAAAVRAAEADGNSCDNVCAVAVARGLGARWVAKGTITNLSNIVWMLTAELFDATTGKPVLADSYEIKGDPARMAPAAAHVFAQRVEKAITAAQAAAP
jgi:TolB-like protein